MGLELVVKLLADSSGLVKGTSEGGKSIEAFGKSIDIGGVAKVAAFAGVAGIAVAAITEMTLAASDDAAEQDRLALAIKNAGAETATSNALVDEAIAKGQDRAFTDSEVRVGLENLVGVTGDVGQATELLTTAQDLARAKGISLEQASVALAKAHEGNTGALRKLLPAIDSTANATDAIAQAQKLAAGQADKYAASTKGQMESSSIAFSELSETIGSAFLPILAEILPAIKPVIAALGQIITAILPILIPLLKVVGSVLGIVATAIGQVASALATLITWITKAIGKINDLVAKLGPIKSVAGAIGGIIGRSVPAAGASARALGAEPFGAAGWSTGSSAGAVTINAYGDAATIELAVIRALRRYDRRNGADQVVPRWS